MGSCKLVNLKLGCHFKTQYWTLFSWEEVPMQKRARMLNYPVTRSLVGSINSMYGPRWAIPKFCLRLAEVSRSKVLKQNSILKK